jgi:hypothetical protein
MDLITMSRWETRPATVLGDRDGWISARVDGHIATFRSDLDCERGQPIEVLLRDGTPVEARALTQ